MKVLLIIVKHSEPESDSKVRSRSASDTYRDNFDRIFSRTTDNDKSPESHTLN